MEHKANWPGSRLNRWAMISGALAAAMLWCWVESRALVSARSSYASAQRQLREMRADAAAIASLRSAPRCATDRERPNDELLDLVRKAISAVDMPPDAWIANDPAEPMRIPQLPYKRLEVRIGFAELTLRHIVQFACKLIELDPTLSIPRVRLTGASKEATDRWNVDLTVQYLIYSPYQDGSRP